MYPMHPMGMGMGGGGGRGNARPYGGATGIASGYRRNSELGNKAIRAELRDLTRLQNEPLSPEGFSAYLAPRTEALGQGYNAATSDIARRMAASGMGNSSMAAGAYGTAAAGRANAGAGLVSQAYDVQDRRQDAYRQAAIQLAQSMSGQGATAAEIAMRRKELEQQIAAMEAAQSFGVGDLIGGLAPGIGFGIGRGIKF